MGVMGEEWGGGGGGGSREFSDVDVWLRILLWSDSIYNLLFFLLISKTV